MDATFEIRTALSALEASGEAVDKATARVDDVKVEDAVQSLARMREVIAQLRRCEAGFERWIAEVFADQGWRDPHEFPGVGAVEVRRSKTRRAWDHEALQRKWLDAHMAETGGEVLEPAEVVTAYRKVAQVSGYKVTGLKELGIYADDFCDSEPGTPRVVITGSPT